MAGINCVVVTPEETALEQEVDSIVVPLFDGSKGIQHNHAPMIGRLGTGEMKLSAAGNVQRFFLEGGFIQVLDNTVTVLTGQAVDADSLNLDDIQTQLEKLNSQGPAVGDEQESRAKQVTSLRIQRRLARQNS
ncbi:MAG: FoF1 ATP synthase subunit delta/epsilon [Pirellulaceae bacterium]